MVYQITIPFIDNYYRELVATVILLIVFTILRWIFLSIITRYGTHLEVSDSRVKLIKKYANVATTSLAVFLLFAIWGIKGEQIFLVISSVLTLIGVAFFAQWSILSNITSGVILFFSFPFKIGDRIKILDKDFPIEAEIEDIKSFYTLLKTTNGEEISYPNNLLLQKGIVILPKIEHEA